ncbi:hypothetical protein LCGC14_2132090 [marine sediment metagenome]|uniref:Uncharacterized protein n=1 Tax=marine sediment metagenome TaxID=412755 RepID=A0A0F9GE27_9ZZZZ
MSDMREKVARAIASADERNDGPPYEMRVKNKHSREMLFDEAAAAIEAYRVPTEAMMWAALDEYGKTPDMPDEEIERICNAMTDAALEGK